MKLALRRLTALSLSAILIFSAMFSSVVQAKMISSEQAQVQVDRQVVLDRLASVEVQEKLKALGVDANELESRVNNLSTAELEQLNAQIEDLPAGSGAVGILVFLFIVLVVTDMIGATDVFPFVNKV